MGGASQTNCSALEELVAKVTRQNELSERILSELENIPKSQRGKLTKIDRKLMLVNNIVMERIVVWLCI